MNKQVYEQANIRITFLNVQDVVRTSADPTAITVEGDAIDWQESWGK